MGPDAFIVQDLGLASLIRHMAPDQRIHASTQMTVTNADAIKLVDDLKIDRFVLGRENSLNEIKLIRSQTDKELEVFVHGACVSLILVNVLLLNPLVEEVPIVGNVLKAVDWSMSSG